jgi:hypothetical protein
MPGKIVKMDEQTRAALEDLAQDRMMTFQEVADEAFTDVLRKYNRGIDLKDALKKSVREDRSKK